MRAASADFALLDLSGERTLNAAQRCAELAAWRLGAHERTGMLARLKTAHRHARSRLAALDDVTYTRTAPLPTSARDIVGWLAGHCDERAAQTRDLLASWRSAARV